MKQQRSLRFVSVAVALLVTFLFQETWALAGVTGNVNGIVHDNAGAPLAGVTVNASSPSQNATATTDSGGHFVLLSLAPDTYTLSLSKLGYQGISVAGTVVFADQTQTVSYMLTKTLKVIALVTSQAGS
jgi:D-arabinose 1-dehydrogenase-like Zn-dependent alcohol dehydrogenase